MILGDFKVVGLTETSISIQPVSEEQTGPALMGRVGQTTIPATVEQTSLLTIAQVITLTITSK